MPHQTIAQKHARLSSFLITLARPEVRAYLTPRGFTADKWQEAWTLIQRSIALRMGKPIQSPLQLERLVTLEREWMPLVIVTLDTHYPDLHAELFGRYQRVTGAALIPLMAQVLSVLEGLAQSEDPRRRAARALLAQRGFTAEVAAELAALVASARELDASPVVAEQTIEEADQAMWAFYVEWSRIARAVIKDKALLRRLGFRRTRRGAAPEEDLEDPVPPAPPPVPVLPAPQPSA